MSSFRRSCSIFQATKKLEKLTTFCRYSILMRRNKKIRERYFKSHIYILLNSDFLGTASPDWREIFRSKLTNEENYERSARKLIYPTKSIFARETKFPVSKLPTYRLKSILAITIQFAPESDETESRFWSDQNTRVKQKHPLRKEGLWTFSTVGVSFQNKTREKKHLAFLYFVIMIS